MTLHCQDWVLRANDGRLYDGSRRTVPLVR
jgi:hypothetical protein